MKKFFLSLGLLFVPFSSVFTAAQVPATVVQSECVPTILSADLKTSADYLEYIVYIPDSINLLKLKNKTVLFSDFVNMVAAEVSSASEMDIKYVKDTIYKLSPDQLYDVLAGESELQDKLIDISKCISQSLRCSVKDLGKERFVIIAKANLAISYLMYVVVSNTKCEYSFSYLKDRNAKIGSMASDIKSFLVLYKPTLSSLAGSRVYNDVFSFVEKYSKKEFGFSKAIFLVDLIRIKDQLFSMFNTSGPELSYVEQMALTRNVMNIL